MRNKASQDRVSVLCASHCFDKPAADVIVYGLDRIPHVVGSELSRQERDILGPGSWWCNSKQQGVPSKRSSII